MELALTDQSMELTVPTRSYKDLMETQRDLLMNQVENLQRIVDAQCELTGVNPLSQEMAAGALSIKIGKKPRDLLNPKAVKYMQLVFSVKDAISKKEIREISAQFGVTATQVRDFFASQRTRLRRFVRLAKEKADKTATCDAMADGMPLPSDQSIPAAEPVPLDTVAPIKIEEGPSCSTQQEILPGVNEPERYFIQNIFRLMRKEESFVGHVKLLEWILRMKNPAVLNWFLTEGGPLILATWLSEAATEDQSTVLRAILKVLSHLPLEKSLPVHMSALLQSVNRLRFYRASDISNRSRILIADWSKLFRKMMEDSKKIKSDSDVQNEMILKQSIEEVMDDEAWEPKENNSGQPLRLLCGIPENMKLDNDPSVKLLTLSGEDSKNRLGSLSSHARARRKIQIVEQPGQRSVVRTSQAVKSTASTQRPLSADDIQKAKMRAQFLQNKHGKTIRGSENQVKPGSRSSVNPLQATKGSTPGSYSHIRPEIEDSKKLGGSNSDVLPEIEESKKVDSSNSGVQTEIEKSKKVGSFNSDVKPEIEEPTKVGNSSSHVRFEIEELKKVGSSDSHVRPEIEVPKNVYSSNSHVRPEIEVPKNVYSSNSHVRPEIEVPKNVYSSNSHIWPEIEERREVNGTPPRVAKTQVSVNVEEPPMKRLKRIQIPWQAPPELKITDAWSVGTGENSKEVEVQKNRNKRERETIYRSPQEIPSNPRSPWDLEMDYDDTLTPIIPIEQLPDMESIETPTSNNENVTVASSSSSSNMPQPDYQLLAELLKNPELVFALTSGQAGDMSSNETVKLLDLIKSKGASGLGNLVGVSGNAENNRVEVSLPSPTPSTDPVPNGLKPDFSRNPFTKQHATVNVNAYQAHPSLQPQATIPASPFALGPTVMAHQPTVQQLTHTTVPPVASLTTVDQYSEQWHTVPESSVHHQMLNYSKTQRFSPEINPTNMANYNRAANFNQAPNLHNTIRSEPLGNVRASPLARSQVQQVHYPEPNALRARQGYESNYYQNSGIQNNYNGYAGGSRNTVMSRSPYESFSPDNSPSRGYEHVPGRNYQDQSSNFRNDFGSDNAQQQPYGYRDNRDKRWNNHRR